MDSSHLKTDLRELAGILKTYGGKNISSSQTSFVIRALQHKLQIFDFEMSFLESNIKKYITHEEAQNVILQYYPPIIPTQPVDTAHKLEMCYNPFTDMPFLTDEQLGGDLENRAIAATAPQDERVLENELRPRSLADFIGQEHLKDSLSIFLQAAQQRGEPLDHVLLYGNPGLGKTTLANIIAGEMGRSCKVTSGPTLEKVGDLAAILTSLEPGDVLFIDEIHRLNRSIEEVLYPALEDFALDLMIGKGPGARSLRMQLNKFTLIGATTRPSLISSPLRDRFGATFHLDFYNDEDMQRIIKRSSGILGLPMDDSAVNKLSAATRRTPRVANRLLRRVRDVAQVEKSSTATEPIVTKTLDMLRVDHLGLDHGDRKILTTIIETFRGGPVGLSTLAAAVAEEMETLETVHEPYLLQIGFLERTPKGRCITPRALEHLGLSVAARGSVR